MELRATCVGNERGRPGGTCRTTAEVRHKTVVAAADMQKAVESYLGV